MENSEEGRENNADARSTPWLAEQRIAAFDRKSVVRRGKYRK